MNATPARDALDELAENMAHETGTSLIDTADVTTWLAANPDLVLAALIESGWRPSDDDLRAMGLVETNTKTCGYHNAPAGGWRCAMSPSWDCGPPQRTFRLVPSMDPKETTDG